MSQRKTTEQRIAMLSESPNGRCSHTSDMFPDDGEEEMPKAFIDALSQITKHGAPARAAKLARINYREALRWLTEYEEIVTTVDLPKFVPRKEWNAYVRERRAMGKAMTKRAEKIGINQLRELHDKGYDAAKVLRQSIDKGWVGLFELKFERPSAVPKGYVPDDFPAP